VAADPTALLQALDRALAQFAQEAGEIPNQAPAGRWSPWVAALLAATLIGEVGRRHWLRGRAGLTLTAGSDDTTVLSWLPGLGHLTGNATAER
jgi:hypothetical protein